MAASDILRNNVREKLARGEVVSSMTVRLSRTIEIARIAKTAGFDMLYIDLEHSPLTLDATGQICMACLDIGIMPAVRVPANTPDYISRILDAGAGGVIGTEIASHATPDGYTILVISLAHAVNPWLYKLPYDPIKAFAPIGVMGSGPNVVAVNPELPVKSIKELVALAKSKPGDLQYASAGIGSFQHLGGELFKLEAGIDMLHVPFKGGGPAMIDVIGGHTKVVFSSLVQTTPHIKSGKLRALGVGSKERSKVLPDVPSVAEAGVPSYEAVNWWGIVAPAGTPQPIIDKLHAALTAAQDSAEVEKQFATEGATVVKKSPTEFGAFMVSEMNKWELVVKKGGITAQ